MDEEQYPRVMEGLRAAGPSLRRPRRDLHRRMDLPAALLGHLDRPLLRLHDGLRQAVLRRSHRVHFREL